MNKLKILLILILLNMSVFAASPYVTSDNIIYGDSVYYKIPLNKTYAADVYFTFSDNLEFISCEEAIAINISDNNIHAGFITDIPEYAVFCFKATDSGDAFFKLEEITYIADDLMQTEEYPALVTDFNIKSNKPSRPSGGGGGGGGTSSSSGGGSSSVYIPPTVQNTPVKLETILPFKDIADDMWAKEYITRLYEKNVISKDEYFRPNDNITRAEFVKLAVVAFNIEAFGGECTFSDVASDDWFFGYVSAAQNAGIIKGDGDKFNSTNFITREDICVILNRILNAVPAVKSSDFIDFDSVSEYAKESVLSLSELGIVNGNENGEFMPQQFATRAETAKMICMATEAQK